MPHVNGRPVILGHSNNLVALYKPTIAPVTGRRTPGNQPFNLCRPVFRAQECTNAHKGELHLDVEVLKGTGRHVGRVRVKSTGHGRQIALQYPFGIIIIQNGAESFEALQNCVLNRRGIGIVGLVADLSCKLLPQVAVLNTAPPEIVPFLPAGGTGFITPLPRVGLVYREIEPFLQDLPDIVTAVMDPLSQDFEEFVGELQVASSNLVVQPGALVGKPFFVFRQQVQ